MPRWVYVRSPELKEKLRNNFWNKEWFSFWEWKSRSEETKEKLRQARIWKKANDETKDKMRIARKWKASWMKWKKHSEETRSKISISLQWEKCYKWKWWVSDENNIIRHWSDMKIWRDNVFNRDNFACKKCWKIWWTLNAHHILNYSSNEHLRFDINNWVTLCKKCHIEFHKIYWKLNNTLEQLNEYLLTNENFSIFQFIRHKYKK